MRSKWEPFNVVLFVLKFQRFWFVCLCRISLQPFGHGYRLSIGIAFSHSYCLGVRLELYFGISVDVAERNFDGNCVFNIHGHHASTPGFDTFLLFFHTTQSALVVRTAASCKTLINGMAARACFEKNVCCNAAESRAFKT